MFIMQNKEKINSFHKEDDLSENRNHQFQQKTKIIIIK